MYPKEITHLIIECWGKGLTAEETRDYIEMKRDLRIGLATVYRHRHSMTGQQMIDELFREQRRDIALEQDGDTRMRYRNELLKILVPQRVESYSYSKEEKNVKVDVEGLLAEYEDLFEEATILENCAPEPIHPTQTNRKTSPVPPT